MGELNKMDKQELFDVIRRNNHKRYYAITLISDFMMISRRIATQIYNKEFGNDDK